MSRLFNIRILSLNSYFVIFHNKIRLHVYITYTYIFLSICYFSLNLERMEGTLSLSTTEALRPYVNLPVKIFNETFFCKSFSFTRIILIETISLNIALLSQHKIVVDNVKDETKRKLYFPIPSAHFLLC